MLRQRELPSFSSSFTSLAPCRLCLFGEHQDYLGLPVIALSLPLYCRIVVVPQTDSRIICLEIPTIDKTIRYDLDHLPPRQDINTKEPDFALAALHEALDDGWLFAQGGANCVSTVDLPMKAGCSTSSAFTVAWIQMLAALANQTLTPLQLAKRAHQAEVVHFRAPGGTMDHITSALGGLLRIGPGAFQVEALPLRGDVGVWVLGYSGEPKDTMKHLKRCKDSRIALLEKLGGDWDNDKGTLLLLNDDELELQRTTCINRDVESTAFAKWKMGSAKDDNDEQSLGRELGTLMMRHHEALRDGLRLSTDVLEAMNSAAMNSGAWGFKVVGSGGGGCGVAWTAPARAETVAMSMENAGAVQTWIIREPSSGAHIEHGRVTGTH